MQEYIKNIRLWQLIISNGEIIKILKSVEDSGLLLKGVDDTIQNELKEQLVRTTFNW